MQRKPRIIVFASGGLHHGQGGSGFENLVAATRTDILRADIIAVVSNHAGGGVATRAKRLGIPFIHFPAPWDNAGYMRIVRPLYSPWVALSGWLKLVSGLDPRMTFNIHPGPLPRFGGNGMYGIHVHEAVLEAFRRREVGESAVTMHFVTERYDEGPVFFRMPVAVASSDTPESLAHRVNEAEHFWQPLITNFVVSGRIAWDGKNPASLKIPPSYQHL